MIRLLRRNGVIVGAEEQVTDKSGKPVLGWYEPIPIVDLDEPKDVAHSAIGNCHPECLWEKWEKKIVELVGNNSQTKPMEDGMEKVRWCEDIEHIEGKPVIRVNEINEHSRLLKIPEWWKQCPICGTPRPEPVKKSLADRFIEWHKKTDYTSENQDLHAKANQLADIAKEVLLGEDREHGLIDLLNATMKIPMAKRAKAILNFLRGEGKD